MPRKKYSLFSAAKFVYEIKGMVIMKIILASNNKNKLREFKKILEPYGMKVVSLSEAGINSEPDENGGSFEENAYIKAKAAYDIAGLPVIADDSGLCVDALNGKPGIFSARYAEPGQRCNKILSELEGVNDENRTAKFVCVICYIDNSGEKHLFRGECSGKIDIEKRGENGFGYDPIFLFGEKTFAELTDSEKNSVSHRANALKKFESFLKSEGK